MMSIWFLRRAIMHGSAILLLAVATTTLSELGSCHIMKKDSGHIIDENKFLEFVNQNAKAIDADFNALKAPFERLGNGDSVDLRGSFKISARSFTGNVVYDTAKRELFDPWKITGDLSFSSDKSQGTFRASSEPDARGGKLSIGGVFSTNKDGRQLVTACVGYVAAGGRKISTSGANPKSGANGSKSSICRGPKPEEIDTKSKKSEDLEARCKKIFNSPMAAKFAKDMADCTAKLKQGIKLPEDLSEKLKMADRAPPPLSLPGIDGDELAFVETLLDVNTDGEFTFYPTAKLTSIFDSVKPSVAYTDAALKASVQIPKDSLKEEHRAYENGDSVSKYGHVKTTDEINLDNWATVSLERDTKMKTSKDCAAEAKIKSLKYKVDLDYDYSGTKTKITSGRACAYDKVSYIDDNGKDITTTLETTKGCLTVAKQLAFAVCEGLENKLDPLLESQLK